MLEYSFNTLSAFRRLMREFPFYTELQPSVQSKFITILSLSAQKKGDVLFRSGDSPDRCYIVISGEVSVWKRDVAGAPKMDPFEIKRVVGTLAAEKLCNSISESQEARKARREHGHDQPISPKLRSLRNQRRKDESMVARLGAGTMFGELALLNDDSRNATVICEEDSIFIVVERSHFNEMLKHDMQSMKYREMAELTTPLLMNYTFFTQMNPALFEEVPQMLRYRQGKRGEIVCYQGERAQACFLVLSGRVSLWQSNEFGNIHLDGRDQFKSVVDIPEDLCPTIAAKLAEIAEKDLKDNLTMKNVPLVTMPMEETMRAFGDLTASLTVGDIFHEEALLHSNVTSCMSICDEDCEFLLIDRDSFVAMENEKLKSERDRHLPKLVEPILQRLPFIKKLQPEVRNHLPSLVRYSKESQGNVLFKSGEAPSRFYILLSGIVGIYSHAGALSVNSAALCDDDCRTSFVLGPTETSALVEQCTNLSSTLANEFDLRPFSARSVSSQTTEVLREISRPNSPIQCATQCATFMVENATLEERTGSKRCISRRPPALNVHRFMGDDSDTQVSSEGPQASLFPRSSLLLPPAVQRELCPQDYGRLVTKVGIAGIVGEEELLVASRTTTAVCLVDCEVLYIDLPDFLSLKRTEGNKSRLVRFAGKVQALLEEYDLFAGFPPSVLTAISQCVRLQCEKRGSVIFKPGEMCDRCHILLSGHVLVSSVVPGRSDKECRDTSKRSTHSHSDPHSPKPLPSNSASIQSTLTSPQMCAQLLSLLFKGPICSSKFTDGEKDLFSKSRAATSVEPGSLLGTFGKSWSQLGKCAEDSEFLVIDSVDVDRLVKVDCRTKIHEKTEFLRRWVSALRHMQIESLENFSHCFELETLPINHIFFAEGANGTGLIYVVVEGSVEFLVTDAPPLFRGTSFSDSNLLRLTVLQRGGIFASQLPGKLPEPFFAVATSSHCKVYRVSLECARQLPDDVVRSMRELAEEATLWRLTRVSQRPSSEGSQRPFSRASTRPATTAFQPKTTLALQSSPTSSLRRPWKGKSQSFVPRSLSSSSMECSKLQLDGKKLAEYDLFRISPGECIAMTGLKPRRRSELFKRLPPCS